MKLPPHVRAGQPVSASDYNRLLDYVLSITPRAGAGLTASPNFSGTILALAANSPENVVFSVVTRVYGQRGDRAENVRYDAVGFGRPDIRVENKLPAGGRTFAEGVAVVPAQVDDPCYIIRVPTDGVNPPRVHLIVLTESYITFTCESSGMDAMVAEEERLRRSGQLPSTPQGGGQQTGSFPGGPTDGGSGGEGHS